MITYVAKFNVHSLSFVATEKVMKILQSEKFHSDLKEVLWKNKEFKENLVKITMSMPPNVTRIAGLFDLHVPNYYCRKKNYSMTAKIENRMIQALVILNSYTYFSKNPTNSYVEDKDAMCMDVKKEEIMKCILRIIQTVFLARKNVKKIKNVELSRVDRR